MASTLDQASIKICWQPIYLIVSVKLVQYAPVWGKADCISLSSLSVVWREGWIKQNCIFPFYRCTFYSLPLDFSSLFSIHSLSISLLIYVVFFYYSFLDSFVFFLVFLFFFFFTFSCWALSFHQSLLLILSLLPYSPCTPFLYLLLYLTQCFYSFQSIWASFLHAVFSQDLPRDSLDWDFRTGISVQVFCDCHQRDGVNSFPKETLGILLYSLIDWLPFIYFL